MPGVLSVTASRQYCSPGFRSSAVFVRVVYVRASLSLRRGWRALCPPVENMAVSLCASWLMSPGDTRRDNKYRLLQSQLR